MSLKIINRPTLLLSFIVFITVIGLAKPIFFNEGSAAFKYINRQLHLEAIGEEQMQDYAASLLYGDTEAPSEDISEVKVISEEEAYQRKEYYWFIDKSLAATFFILSLLFIICPRQLRQWHLHHSLLFILIWVLSQALAVSFNGGKAFSQVALAAHATRWMAILALWFCLQKKLFKRESSAQLPQALFWMTTLAVATTFFTHGIEAMLQNPSFHNLISVSFSYFNYRPSVGFVEILLYCIGFMDVALALSILFYRSNKIYLWMTFWGLLTASSRPFTMGIEAWPETAVRVANFGLPFLLFIVLHKSCNQTINNKNTGHQ